MVALWLVVEETSTSFLRSVASYNWLGYHNIGIYLGNRKLKMDFIIGAAESGFTFFDQEDKMKETWTQTIKGYPPKTTIHTING